ncbi:MAG: Imm50 family immunity protein [Anaerotignum sp.]
MWIDKIDQTEYIQRLYDVVPNLENIKLLKVEFEKPNDKIRIRLLLPIAVDNPPRKWTEHNDIYPIIDIDLFGINVFTLKNIKDKDVAICNLFWDKDLEGNVVVLCKGECSFEIVSECGVIQTITGASLK